LSRKRKTTQAVIILHITEFTEKGQVARFEVKIKVTCLRHLSGSLKKSLLPHLARQKGKRLRETRERDGKMKES
jgi:hypothetical protein